MLFEQKWKCSQIYIHIYFFYNYTNMIEYKIDNDNTGHKGKKSPHLIEIKNNIYIKKIKIIIMK